MLLLLLFLSINTWTFVSSLPPNNGRWHLILHWKRVTEVMTSYTERAWSIRLSWTTVSFKWFSFLLLFLDTLEFIVKDWTISFPGGIQPPPNIVLPKQKMVFRDHVSFLINCSTNDPTADVKLLQTQSQSQVLVDAMTVKGSRLTRNGQAFIIDKVKSEDGGKYQCVASNTRDGEIELTLGLLIVNIRKLYWFNYVILYILRSSGAVSGLIRFRVQVERAL